MEFFDNPKGEEEQSLDFAFMVHADMPGWGRQDLAECQLLIESAGATVSQVFAVKRQNPDPKYFIGRGKVEEIAADVATFYDEHKIKPMVIVNHPLSPAQERNLETHLECRVLDRTGLILDIFAQRARTFEGRLQVELAQLRHLSTRLVRGWTHLERQKGGIGLRGPGESQLETDRRLIRVRIKNIEGRLQKVRSQRHQGRRARLRNDVQSLGLVGYTNAGKSSLFNTLTDADVYAQDQLFATLDPTLRKLAVDGIGDCVLADTVGFIRQLPTQLVAAFKATLEETTSAKLLLHVVDAAALEREENMAAVDAVLKEVGASDVPMLVVMNKIDLMENDQPRLERDENGTVTHAWVSARTGAGLDLLKLAIAERLSDNNVVAKLSVPIEKLSEVRARLYKMHALKNEEFFASGDVAFDIQMQQRHWQQLKKEFDLRDDMLVKH